jgi:hypothetical protein
VDIAHGEMVEKELDGLITRRHDRRVADEGERPLEEAWAESERRHNARRRAQNRWEWVRYHEGQAERHRRNLEALVAHHESEAAKYMDTDEWKETA